MITEFDNLSSSTKSELEVAYEFRKLLFSKIGIPSRTKVIVQPCYLRYLEFNNMIGVDSTKENPTYKLVIHNTLSVDLAFSESGSDFSIFLDGNISSSIELDYPHRFII
jgi:hypothetical protein